MQLHSVCCDSFCYHFVIFTHYLNETPSLYSVIVFFSYRIYWIEFRVFIYSAIMWQLQGAIGPCGLGDRCPPAGSRGRDSVGCLGVFGMDVGE